MEAGATRLRPILMTTTSMVCGMMPIALALAGGAAEFKSSLGVVLIGGLLSSLFLTLLLVPVAYSAFESLRGRMLARGRKRSLSGAEAAEGAIVGGE